MSRTQSQRIGGLEVPFDLSGVLLLFEARDVFQISTHYGSVALAYFQVNAHL